MEHSTALASAPLYSWLHNMHVLLHHSLQNDSDMQCIVILISITIMPLYISWRPSSLILSIMTTNHSWSFYIMMINASLLSFIMTSVITDLHVCHDPHHYCMISPSSAETSWWILYPVCAKLSTHYPCKHHFGRDWPFSLSLIYLTLIHWLLPLQPHLERIVNNFCPDFPTPEEKQKVRMILAAVHH